MSRNSVSIYVGHKPHSVVNKAFCYFRQRTVKKPEGRHLPDKTESRYFIPEVGKLLQASKFGPVYFYIMRVSNKYCIIKGL